MQQSFLTSIIALTILFGYIKETRTNFRKNDIINANGVKQFAEQKKVSFLKGLEDCTTLVETLEDGWTVSKNTLVVASDDKKNGFGIQLRRSDKGNISFSIQVAGGQRCYDKGDKVQILFTDDSQIELESYREFNCESGLVFGLGPGKESLLQALKSKKIKTMKVPATKFPVERTFTEKNTEDFYQTINCLAKK